MFLSYFTQFCVLFERNILNKVDLVRSLVEREELPRKTALAIVDGFFSDIENAILSGEAVKIPGFGQFRVRDRAARMGRNPATGESIKIAAKRVFKFLPAKALKDAVMSKKTRKTVAPKATKVVAKKTAGKKVSAKKTVAAKVTTGKKRGRPPGKKAS